ncbi:MAG: uracil-DNA glycosylase [Candidatus Altiarchaeales archaeon]|nr:uracil-DNA glycosylase [Candidatus Altiarchaeales archaeon]
MSKPKVEYKWWWNLNKKKNLWDPAPRKGRTIVDPAFHQHNKQFKWEYLNFWNSDEWQQIRDYLNEISNQGRVFHPGLDYKKIFRPLFLTPFKDTRVVILGQDPYYKKGLADGLAFSVQPNTIKIPGSLSNILREYRDDLGYRNPRTGDLSHWARRGVLLINAIWTVEDEKPKSHYKINGKQLWQELTAEILRKLSVRKEKMVFILWGKAAQEWRYMIDEDKHLVLIGPHPSPRNFTLTSKDGLKFFGGQYFSKTCDFLDLPYSFWRLP